MAATTRYTQGPRMGAARRRHRHDRHHRLRRRAARRRGLRRAAGGRARKVKKGEGAAVVELVKAASDVYSPVSGEVDGDERGAHRQPAAVNEAPEDGGWFMKIKIADKSELDGLLDEDGYRDFVDDASEDRHGARISRRRSSGGGDEGEDFAKGRYSRAHEWRFDGGITRPGLLLAERRAAPLLARGRGRPGGDVRRRAFELPHADLPRSRAARRLRRRLLRGRGGRHDGADRAAADGDHAR